MIKRYFEYLKDNPEGHWFKRRLFGWGWVPVRWQGWLVTLAYIIFIVIVSRSVDKNSQSTSDILLNVFIPLGIATAVLITVAYKKGEKPRWQWGIPKKD